MMAEQQEERDTSPVTSAGHKPVTQSTATSTTALLTQLDHHWVWAAQYPAH